MKRKREFLKYAARIKLRTASVNLMIKTIEELKGLEHFSGDVYGLEWNGKEWVEKKIIYNKIESELKNLDPR